MSLEQLQSLVQACSGERALQSFFKEHPDLLGKSCSFRPEWGEYIVFSEYPTLDGRVDFVVMSDRSRLAIVFIELKGADFSFLTEKGTINAHINEAAQQIRSRYAAVEESYHTFRSRFHQHRREAEAGSPKFGAFVGHAKRLQVDPEKDIYLRGIVIGGHGGDKYKISKERHRLERESRRITFETWDSWLESNGEIGGSLYNHDA